MWERGIGANGCGRENVCIVPGGRAGLIRIAAVLGNCYLGFFIPGTLRVPFGKTTELTVTRLHRIQRDVIALQKRKPSPPTHSNLFPTNKPLRSQPSPSR